MGRHRLLEHTADMGIEAEGSSREDLFIETARGVRDMIFAESEVVPRESRPVSVEGGDAGELLVNWLNEILFLYETRRFVPGDFSIELLGNDRLEGTVRGEIFDPERHFVEREVKAVTYHQLRVEQSTDGNWRTKVYVDL